MTNADGLITIDGVPGYFSDFSGVKMKKTTRPNYSDGLTNISNAKRAAAQLNTKTSPASAASTLTKTETLSTGLNVCVAHWIRQTSQRARSHDAAALRGAILKHSDCWMPYRNI